MSGLLTLEQVQEAVQIGMSRGAGVVHQVLQEVAVHSGVAQHLILSRGRADKVARARHLVIRAAYDHGASVQEIAEVLRRDRTTILHALSGGAVDGARPSRCQPQRPSIDGGSDA